MNSLCLRRSSELKRILCTILFQSFIDLIFIELEPVFSWLYKGSEGYINYLELIILKALFWAR